MGLAQVFPAGLAELAKVTGTKDLPVILDKYKEVFSDELGTIHPYEAHLSVREDAKPKFCKYRTVPFAVREVVEQELDRLEAEGVV